MPTMKMRKRNISKPTFHCVLPLDELSIGHPHPRRYWIRQWRGAPLASSLGTKFNFCWIIVFVLLIKYTYISISTYDTIFITSTASATRFHRILAPKISSCLPSTLSSLASLWSYGMTEPWGLEWTSTPYTLSNRNAAHWDITGRDPNFDCS